MIVIGGVSRALSDGGQQVALETHGADVKLSPAVILEVGQITLVQCM